MRKIVVIQPMGVGVIMSKLTALTKGVIFRYASVQDQAGAFCYEITTKKEQS